MEKITEILARKQPHFKKISPSCTINDALCRMSTQNTDYLIVMDDNNNFLGLLTEHDVATKSIYSDQPLTKTQVRQMMNTRLPFADEGDTVEQCLRLMKRHNVRYLPVFSNFHFLGIVSGDDILTEALSHRGDIFDEEERII
jgi:signal-transduction protein with cAMP-binding, CBS, and nucleotidyltransferase domain